MAEVSLSRNQTIWLANLTRFGDNPNLQFDPASQSELLVSRSHTIDLVPVLAAAINVARIALLEPYPTKIDSLKARFRGLLAESSKNLIADTQHWAEDDSLMRALNKEPVITEISGLLDERITNYRDDISAREVALWLDQPHTALAQATLGFAYLGKAIMQSVTI